MPTYGMICVTPYVVEEHSDVSKTGCRRVGLLQIGIGIVMQHAGSINDWPQMWPRHSSCLSRRPAHRLRGEHQSQLTSVQHPRCTATGFTYAVILRYRVAPQTRLCALATPRRGSNTTRRSAGDRRTESGLYAGCPP